MAAWLCPASLPAATLQATQVQLPIYLPGTPSAATVIRIERLEQDYQRKGFFRIGLLPAVLAEGVTIEIRNPGRAAEALASAAASLRGLGKARPVELRRVSVRLLDDTRPVLEAGALSLGGKGEWQFSRDVLLVAPTNIVRASQMTLATQGPQAGRLHWGKNASLPLLDCLRRTGNAVSPSTQPDSK